MHLTSMDEAKRVLEPIRGFRAIEHPGGGTALARALRDPFACAQVIRAYGVDANMAGPHRAAGRLLVEAALWLILRESGDVGDMPEEPDRAMMFRIKSGRSVSYAEALERTFEWFQWEEGRTRE